MHWQNRVDFVQAKDLILAACESNDEVIGLPVIQTFVRLLYQGHTGQPLPICFIKGSFPMDCILPILSRVDNNEVPVMDTTMVEQPIFPTVSSLHQGLSRWWSPCASASIDPRKFTFQPDLCLDNKSASSANIFTYSIGM